MLRLPARQRSARRGKGGPGPRRAARLPPPALPREAGAGGPRGNREGTGRPRPVSYEQVLEARAMKDKNLQLRALALDNAWSQLKTRAAATGRRPTASTRPNWPTSTPGWTRWPRGPREPAAKRSAAFVESIKPRQAKELVVGMLDNGEEDEVVLLLSGMSDSKRAKLLAEFKTADENKKIDDVLRRIRQGVAECAAGRDDQGATRAARLRPGRGAAA